METHSVKIPGDGLPSELEPGNYAQLVISDSGEGMDAETVREEDAELGRVEDHRALRSASTRGMAGPFAVGDLAPFAHRPQRQHGDDRHGHNE